jgi:glutathione S-transferase
LAELLAPVVLYGYRYSVYLRIVCMALVEKGVGWSHVEVNPFAEAIPAYYLALHPFGRVPTLKHGDFVVYETAAITRYIDDVFPKPRLRPGAHEPDHRDRRFLRILADGAASVFAARIQRRTGQVAG